LYDFTNSSLYLNCIRAQNNSDFKADFLNPQQNKLQIGGDSAAKGSAEFSFSAGTNDVLGLSRTNPSDIGAYNFTIFEED
jgi:hypothetical protein